MTDRQISTLARMTVVEGVIDPRVGAYALGKLSRPELKKYLGYLREEVRRQRVFVRLPTKPDAETRKKFEAMYPGKNVIFEEKPGMGAGVQIEHADTVVTLDVQNLIERTLHQLKESV